MPEPQDPKPRIPPMVPGAPIPRIWKAEPEVDPEEVAAEAKAAKKKAKKDKAEAESAAKGKPKAKSKKDKSAGKVKDGEPKGVLLEQTPRFDTQETRQRIRLAIGAVLLLVFGLGTYLGYRYLTSAPSETEAPTDLGPVAASSGVSLREKDEQEAKVLLVQARDIDKKKKTDMAVKLLERVVARFPTTTSGVEAKASLARFKQNFPLFSEQPMVVATPVETPKPADLPAPTTVNASKPVAISTSGADASLVLPSNAPKPAAPGPASPIYHALPPGFHASAGTSADSSTWPKEIVGDRDNAPMVLVKGATFTQGRNDGETTEGPEHQVNLGSYYIDRHEVTVRQFDLFQKEKGRYADRDKAITHDSAIAKAADDMPVVMVKAIEAAEYAAWAGKRLPTEAQWEAAARTPDARLRPWGNDPPESNRTRSPRQIDPVEMYPLDVSPYGVKDLAGNASEWTNDWFDPRYYRSFRNAPADNPTGPPPPPKGTQQLVIKGTSKEWLVTKREGLRAETRRPDLGFRCVLTVEGPGNAFEPPAPKAPAPPVGQKPTGSGAPAPPF